MRADVSLHVNVNEVRDTLYVTADELRAKFEDDRLAFTPWFKLICQSMLFEWWDHLLDGSLDRYTGEKAIRRM